MSGDSDVFHGLETTSNVIHKPIPETDLQRQLKEKIALHTKQASDIRSLLNTRTAISRLPPEILSEIFLAQAAIVCNERVALHIRNKESDSHKSFYRWLNVSHVCRHWREVAFKCPYLWTWAAWEERINPRFIRKLLRRSFELPLTYVYTANYPSHCASCIGLDDFYGSAYDGFDLMLEYMNRIRELTVLVEREEFYNIWEKTATVSAPVLEVFKIQAVGSSQIRRGDQQDSLVDVVLAEKLFNADTPRLRSLVLSGVEFRLNDSILRACPSLCHLEITACFCADEGTLPTFDDFLDVLHCMPNLETLKLDWSLENMIVDGQYTVPPLAHLQMLHLTCKPDFFATLVRHLNLEGKPAVTIHYRYPRYRHDDGNEVGSEDSFRLQIAPTMVSLFKQAPLCAVAYNPFGPILPSDYKRAQESCQLWASKGHVTTDSSAAGDQIHTASPPTSLPARAPRLIFEDLDSGHNIDRSVSVVRALDLSHVSIVHLLNANGHLTFVLALKDAQSTTTVRVSDAVVEFIRALSAGIPLDDSSANKANGSEDDADSQSDGGGGGGDEEDEAGSQGDVPMAVDPDPPVDTQPDESAIADHNDDDAMGLRDTGEAAPSPTNGGDVPSALWPALRVLQFVNVDVDIGPSMNRRLSIDDLLACLRSRKEQHAADILRIEFEYCYIGDIVRLAPLVGMVPEVWWDGKVVDLAGSA
ncbi:hypothetical protein C8Q74DRAFT_1419220 [Fomes fomentarius]|nr:hypothetical protein C8Q74DRAFT_1419220 [Fomes fomentarius]